MLTAVENNDTKLEYTYDVRGNILIKKEYTVSTADDGTKPYTLKENETSSFGYDTVWADKLTSFNGQTIAYDDVGNPLTYRGNALTWNFGRRLASFGNITYTYNEDGIRNLNPFRYRGYYYDTDTSLYYLQSRYYDPETGRFLNADEYHSAKQSTKRDNVYAYCMNNPVMNSDKDGREAVALGSGVYVASAISSLFVPGIGWVLLEGLLVGLCVIGVIVLAGMVVNIIYEASTSKKEKQKNYPMSSQSIQSVKKFIKWLMWMKVEF